MADRLTAKRLYVGNMAAMPFVLTYTGSTLHPLNTLGYANLREKHEKRQIRSVHTPSSECFWRRKLILYSFRLGRSELVPKTMDQTCCWYSRTREIDTNTQYPVEVAHLAPSVNVCTQLNSIKSGDNDLRTFSGREMWVKPVSGNGPLSADWRIGSMQD